MNKTFRKFQWSPWSILQVKIPSSQYAVVVLNRPINFTTNNDTLARIWNGAKIRVTVDGGTDCWLNWIAESKLNPNSMLDPNLITGDMDSISKTTLKYFQSHPKTNVVYTEDQNETDFTKALKETVKLCRERYIELDEIFVLAEISGRFDQLISNINTLFKVRDILGNTRVFIFCPDSFTWLMEEGEHVLDVPKVLKEKQEWCGLLPIGSPAQVLTTGLKWNLNKSILEFGGLISSSNTYNGEGAVTVHTDSPIVWTMGISPLMENVLLDTNNPIEYCINCKYIW